MSIITKQKFDALVPAFRDATDSVYRKMVPQLELYENRTGEFAPYEELGELRERYICLAAAHNAVRSLDLILTGSGFGVISTAEKSPASQARVDALQRQLYEECSDVFDELRTKALSTAWNETSNAQDMVDSFLYTPTLLRKYGVLCEEREVFAREYARLAPQRHEGAIHVLHEISPELYEAMLNWRRVSHRRQFTATTCDENALGKGTRTHGTRYDSGADPQSMPKPQSLLGDLCRLDPRVHKFGYLQGTT